MDADAEFAEQLKKFVETGTISDWIRQHILVTLQEGRDAKEGVMEPEDRKALGEDLDEVERAVARLLKAFELRHPGHTIESIELDTIEVTQMQHDRAHFARRVVIGTRPNPYNEWAT